MSIFDDVTENDFLSQLNSWLGHNPNEACSKGGHAAYGSAVYQIDNDCQERLEIDNVTRIKLQKWLSFLVTLILVTDVGDSFGDSDHQNLRS